MFPFQACLVECCKGPALKELAQIVRGSYPCNDQSSLRRLVRADELAFASAQSADTVYRCTVGREFSAIGQGPQIAAQCLQESLAWSSGSAPTIWVAHVAGSDFP